MCTHCKVYARKEWNTCSNVRSDSCKHEAGSIPAISKCKCTRKASMLYYNRLASKMARLAGARFSFNASLQPTELCDVLLLARDDAMLHKLRRGASAYDEGPEVGVRDRNSSSLQSQILRGSRAFIWAFSRVYSLPLIDFINYSDIASCNIVFLKISRNQFNWE